MHSIIKLLTATLLACICNIAWAEDDEQLEERIKPHFFADSAPASIDYKAYPSVKLANNHIKLNGDDWKELAEKYASASRGESRFSVVYLGDSHIQADFGGSVLRRCLTDKGRYAGRGIIAPFKLAGTNQPTDYDISLSSPYIASSLLRTPWSTEMTFTGIALQPSTDDFVLNLRLPAPTKKLRFHTRGNPLTINDIVMDSLKVPFSTHIDDFGLTVAEVGQTSDHYNVHITGNSSTVIGGIELISDSTGTVVHSIGNNGATYSSYSLIDHFGSELAALNADLVIIALGTNEAFGRTTTEELRANINNLIESIKLYSPQAKILLVGPTECYRRSYVRKKGRRRSRTQVINQKAATMARAIRLYAEENKIAYYNHYAIAGRASAMRSAHLMSKDGVHFTRTGYILWGNLLADALLEQLQ